MEIFYTVLGLVIIILLSGIKVVREYDRLVVFLLGKFYKVKGPGMVFIMPFFQKSVKATLRTITMNIPSQKIITKDNVSIDIAAVAYYHIVDSQ